MSSTSAAPAATSRVRFDVMRARCRTATPRSKDGDAFADLRNTV
jgi:hypothetical protein